jgi:hypothetical protein
MKAILYSIACLVLIWLASITSCKKEKDESSSPNSAPIAKAGQDQILQLQSCNGVGSANLDGSASSDPDKNIVKYSWTMISGSNTAVILNTNSPKTKVDGISAGTSMFLLSVVDERGLSSKDTVLIIATGLVEQYDLDIIFNGSLHFSENLVDCWYYYYGNCNTYDLTTIEGFGEYASIGQFKLEIYEKSDSVNSSPTRETNISIFAGNVNSTSLSGTLTVHFKNLVHQGGGPFSGDFNATSGSADVCGTSFIQNIPALKVTGTLNVTTNTISLRIQGKAYL